MAIPSLLFQPRAFRNHKLHHIANQLLWTAVARRVRRSGAVIGPHQCLSRMQALRAFTMGGARFCGVETQRGALEARKLADLVVLSDNPLHLPEEGLPDLHAHLTFVGGRVV